MAVAPTANTKSGYRHDPRAARSPAAKLPQRAKPHQSAGESHLAKCRAVYPRILTAGNTPL
jgi:hypothetical protein